jgi:hypothetical protein
MFEARLRTEVSAARRAGRHQEALQETGMAESGREGESREAVVAVSVDCMLVFAEAPGSQDNVNAEQRSFQIESIWMST